MEIDIARLETNIEKLADKAGIDDATLEKILAAAEAEMKDRGNSGEKLRQNALNLVEVKLKRRLSGRSNTTNCRGFFLSKGKAFDGSKKPRESAAQYIEEFGLQKAVEDGYASEAGGLLYNDFDWRRGQLIPTYDWQANGVLVIEYDGEFKLADARLKGEAATSNQPIGKMCSIPVYMKTKGENKYDITISNLPVDEEDGYVNLEEYVECVVNAYPDRILSTLLEVEDFVDSDEASKFGSWCIVEGNVMEMSIARNNSTAVRIEDASLSIDGEDSSMMVFFPEGFDVDMKSTAVGATFIVSPYRNMEGKITLNGLGYWVVDRDRAFDSPVGDQDVQDPW